MRYLALLLALVCVPAVSVICGYLTWQATERWLRKEFARRHDVDPDDYC